jgi:hypothetical protein
MTYLPGVDLGNLNNAWQPVSSQINGFISLINSVKKLKESTTVADRIADFQTKIVSGFNGLNTAGASVNDIQEKADDLTRVYQEFLGDFLITEYYAQYRLSDTDSMLLALNENNFITPIDNMPYIISLGDSMNIRVEDPTLLESLKEKTMVQVETANQLPFMSAFENYEKTIDSLQTFYLEVKRTYRRNLDITIKTKELDDLLPRIKDVGAFSAYSSFKSFVDIVPQSNSFSEIRDVSAEALIAAGSFVQIYNDNFFGKLDTLHNELIGHLNEFESLVSAMRRNKFSFNWAIDNFNTNLNAIKSPSGSDMVPKLQQIKTGLEEVFIFAGEGDDRTVNGVFSTQIVNHGKVYGRTAQKSWEDE